MEPKEIKIKADVASLLRAMVSPHVIFISIVAGVFTGFMAPEFSKKIGHIGDLYLTLLQMCIIPILFTAITYSIASLLKQKNVHFYLKKVFIIFFLGLFIAGLIGVSVSTLIGVGRNLNTESQQVVGQLLAQSEMDSPVEDVKELGIMSFVRSMVTNNIFEAFSNGKSLAILFFSILFGISLGKTPKSESAAIFEVLEDLNQTFLRLISGLMYGLPIGLFCLFAGQISSLGLAIFMALIKVVFAIYLVAFIAILFYSLILWKVCGKSFLYPFYQLRKPLTVAFATSSSYATIPSSLKALEENIGLDKKFTQLVMPLGVCMNPQASTFLVSILAMFMMQFYNIPITFQSGLIIIVGSFMTGIAMGGAPGVGALAMLSIVLKPLGLPVAPAIVIALAILPITESILTCVNIYVNCAVTIFLGKKVI